MNADNGGNSSRLGPLVYLADNWISLLGVLLTTTGGVAWLFTLPAHFGGGDAHPYLGLLTVFALPLVFFVGLALIPLGIRLKEGRERRAGSYPKSFPPPRWGNPAFRKLLSFVMLATCANVVIGGHLTYSAVEYMDSVSFCGTACHIMTPEFTAHQHAPHAQVACVDCHIGEGADSYVAAKLNGARQLAGVLTGTFPTPVPTPVHNLAQGSLTCGQCHSERDFGGKPWSRTYFESDEANSAKHTQLTLHIGGGANPTGAHGGHLSGQARVEYRSDPDRETVQWLRYTAPDGEQTVYVRRGFDTSEAERYELREMDCVDCHNRAAHSFDAPSEALDELLVEGRIDPSLPFVKRQSLELLQAGYADAQQARIRIPEALRAFYQSLDPAQVAARREAIDHASGELLALWERNVFPEWGVEWGTHPNQLGHETYPGCFRCHNESLVSEGSSTQPVGSECDTCHTLTHVGMPVSFPSSGGTGLELTRSGGGLPAIIAFDTSAGSTAFDHDEHVGYQDGDCTVCHNRLFPMERAPLGYKADLHRAAEAAGSSCAGCHVSSGSAFASAGNCTKCHTGLSEPTLLSRASPSTAPNPLPAAVDYVTGLGTARFDHSRHAERAETACTDCHNQLFPMAKAPLDYGREVHRAAEAARSSCAGCHVRGGTAFASVGHCADCHVGLGTPQPTPETGLSGIPDLPTVETRLGAARFGHARHVELTNNNCGACHNKVFPLAKGMLNYADNLHRTAEESRTSCAACHYPGGQAFPSKDNCMECHADLSASARGSTMGLPEEVVYANRLADVIFDHDQHIGEARGDCGQCHGELFPMGKASLEGYAEDYHRSAERDGSSCASCHAPARSAFGSLNNCTRCHKQLELPREASLWASPWALMLLLALPAGLGGQQRDQGRPRRGLIGSDRCAVCHEPQASEFGESPHSRLLESNRWASSQGACESCHGPGLEHVQALDPAELEVFGRAQPDRVNEACLSCHRNEAAQAGRFFSDHMRNGVACADCHRVHGETQSKLLKAQTDSLCSSCHADVRAAFNRPFRHKLNEGAISCVDCHDPHGQPPPAQAVRAFANDTSCVRCHGDKRGPFPFEHAPVRLEPCSSCHEPHGSANPRMLARADVSQLCLECHTTSLAALGGSPPAFHDLRSARFRSCTVCHSKIHGSFASRDFLR